MMYRTAARVSKDSSERRTKARRPAMFSAETLLVAMIGGSRVTCSAEVERLKVALEIPKP